MQVTSFHNEPLGRTTIIIKKSRDTPPPPPHVQIRTLVGLFINRRRPPHINKIPPRVGPGDNRDPTTQTDIFVLHQLRTLPLQPGSRPVRSSKMGSTQYSKQTNSATSRQNRRSRIKKGKKDGDEYEATWRRDAKLIRVPRVNLSIQLVDGRPLVAGNVIDARYTSQPSYFNRKASEIRATPSGKTDH